MACYFGVGNIEMAEDDLMPVIVVPGLFSFGPLPTVGGNQLQKRFHGRGLKGRHVETPEERKAARFSFRVENTGHAQGYGLARAFTADVGSCEIIRQNELLLFGHLRQVLYRIFEFKFPLVEAHSALRLRSQASVPSMRPQKYRKPSANSAHSKTTLSGASCA